MKTMSSESIFLSEILLKYNIFILLYIRFHRWVILFYTLYRWRSVDGNDEACRSCNIAHQVEETQSTQPPKTTMNAKARPTLSSLEGLVQNSPKHHPATYVRFRPRLHQRRHTKHEQSSAKLMKGGTDYVAREYNLKSVGFCY